MKLTIRILAFFVMLILIEANGRNIENEYDESEPSGEQDVGNRMREHHMTQTRHRRRPRQMFTYDYAPPCFHAERSYERRDYRQQDENLVQIVKYLDEIISYLRRPPPPPQPIYIPYPVYQDRPCRCPGTTYKLCKMPSNNASKNKTEPSVPTLDDRGLFEIMREDPNKNWGLIPEEVDEVYDDGNDGARPINLEPVETIRPLRRPAPPVEHGSSQAGGNTAAPVSRPGVCEMAILNCCILSDAASTRKCFARYNCSKTYATNRACEKHVIDKVIEHFSQAYGPTANL